jgi:hypothetical protein
MAGRATLGTEGIAVIIVMLKLLSFHFDRIAITMFPSFSDPVHANRANPFRPCVHDDRIILRIMSRQLATLPFHPQRNNGPH